tara:strand:- start:1277 stop:1564 length:288 start_codon:yes stop_codon:yes gene_type:complete
MNMPSCRSSGLLIDDTQVINGQCKLISIHVNNDSGAPCQIKVFDGTDNTGKELARINLDGIQIQNLEFDMHGVICSNGIFYEETSGDANTYIHFA